MKVGFSDIIFILILCVLLFLFYFHLIIQDPILTYDDIQIIAPIKLLNSLPTYFNFFSKGLIFDIQPVRDFSFFLDNLIGNAIGRSLFHFTNLLIWLLICVCFYISASLFDKNKSNFLMLYLFAFSPIAVSSVAWISARKHLLSSFFILLATLYSYFKRKNYNFFDLVVITILYSASVFSHPINILWPLGFFYVFAKKNYSFNFKVFIFCLMVIFLFLNFYYYKVVYPISSNGINKIIAFDPGFSLLALGRYLFSSLWPFDFLPTSHSEASVKNIIGISLLPLAFFFLYKIKSPWKKKISTHLFLFYFLPLLPVLIMQTNIFSSDTYLLTSLFYFNLLIKLHLKDHLFVRLPLVILLAFFMYTSFNYIKIFNNTDSVWTFSFSKEVTPRSALITARSYTKNKRYAEADHLLRIVQEWEPGLSGLQTIVIENIYLNTNISIADRIKRLSKISPDTTAKHFYLSLLAVNANDHQLYNEHLVKIFNDPLSFKIDFVAHKEIAFAAFFSSCHYFQTEQLCNLIFDKFKEKVHIELWNEGLYRATLSKFNSQGSQIVYNVF